MSIQISMSDDAAELLWWLVKNHLEGSMTPFWDDDEAGQMMKLLKKVTRETAKRERKKAMNNDPKP